MVKVVVKVVVVVVVLAFFKIKKKKIPVELKGETHFVMRILVAMTKK